ncbi:MAG: hypothetical protein Q8N23_27935 [Archangium sp.]|nr:hypothetical protein [Archangium sp.]MDP3156534.1 hypothetical protein [Archangium sp.]MDP3573877.1 hypothetical protein [Archangium sp.]
MTAPQLVLVVFIGLIVFAVIYLRRGGGRGKPGPDPVPRLRGFFERTGYGFADARQAPPQAQAERWNAMYLASMRGQKYQLHLVRSYEGRELHWEQSNGTAGGTLTWSQSWVMPLSSPPRVQFHVSDRSNLTIGERGRTSTWQPAFQNALQIGDPEFDARFVVYGLDEQGVRDVLADSTLRQALMECSHVDLRVLTESVRFSDPMEKNATRWMGGVQGYLKSIRDPGSKFEVTDGMHDHLARLMLSAASLAS